MRLNPALSLSSLSPSPALLPCFPRAEPSRPSCRSQHTQHASLLAASAMIAPPCCHHCLHCCLLRTPPPDERSATTPWRRRWPSMPLPAPRRAPPLHLPEPLHGTCPSCPASLPAPIPSSFTMPPIKARASLCSRAREPQLPPLPPSSSTAELPSPALLRPSQPLKRHPHLPLKLHGEVPASQTCRNAAVVAIRRRQSRCSVEPPLRPSPFQIEHPNTTPTSYQSRQT